jgi:hypothetical protein
MYVREMHALTSGFYCAQKGHCGSGMVFAINPPSTGKTFQAYKAIATGGAAVVYSTATTETTVAVPPTSAPGVIPGYNIGGDSSCNCVCNLALANGYPLVRGAISDGVSAANPAIQGLGVFGGEVGNVQGTLLKRSPSANPS